ncbi:MAG TPA: serine/threonine-protein kinase [Polyangiaceae bacterium]|nr:serine/threonine-protein kinase [Polyangiaceae bacterium]
MSSGENPPGRGLPRPLSGGPVKFGPYWLEARLAVGGTAEVYVARPIDPKGEPRRLVVKRLLPHFAVDEEGRTMFEREAALHAAVRHDNVVQVYASGLAGDEPWLAMELVDGCDLFRLLRRLSGDARTLGVGLSVYVARELLRGLQSAHAARDASGQPMGIIHRDVTPSNVYLSIDGRVKLGDFGIARSASRATMRTGAAMLKGKFAYLAPEQVAGEGFDQRADLFSMAVVFAEMLIGRPLFAGSGQLAVLLAIRDCRIEPLREARAAWPRGLFEVLERALARDPAARFQSAAALSEALGPFSSSPEAARPELGVLVRWVQSAPSSGQMQAVRDSAAKLRAAQAAAPPTEPQELALAHERSTGEYAAIPSFVQTGTGKRFGPWPFARLVEAIATGQVGRGDSIDYMGRGLAPIESIDELSRFLPAMTTATTNRLTGVAAPDFSDDVSPSALVAILLRVMEAQATGVLFAETTDSRRSLPSQRPGLGEAGRKELYFLGGKLHHVASNDASELLGESLVRRGAISRDEQDFALAVLPRYGGRMGDTLIALGLVGSLDIFRAIRDQGRDRLVNLFRWPTGKVTFYSEQSAPEVQFPLDLALPPLILAGLEAALPGDAAFEKWRDRLDVGVRPGPTPSPALRSAPWPPIVHRLLEAVTGPMPLREALRRMAQGGSSTASDAIRALELALAAKLLVLG